MCRNIKTLFNFDPPATDEEIRAASDGDVTDAAPSSTPTAAPFAARRSLAHQGCVSPLSAGESG